MTTRSITRTIRRVAIAGAILAAPVALVAISATAVTAAGSAWNGNKW